MVRNAPTRRLLGHRRKHSGRPKAQVWSYALTMASFVIWAFATSPPTADLLGISEKLAGVILAAAVLFIPAIDFFATSGD